MFYSINFGIYRRFLLIYSSLYYINKSLKRKEILVLIILILFVDPRASFLNLFFLSIRKVIILNYFLFLEYTFYNLRRYLEDILIKVK